MCVYVPTAQACKAKQSRIASVWSKQDHPPPHKVQVQWFPARGQRPQVAKVFSHVSMEVHHQVRVSLEELQQLFGKHSNECVRSASIRSSSKVLFRELNRV